MNNPPLVSIITVVYNGVAHLEKTILSVLNQSYPNIEYIIIDGGSTDGTVEIIRRYGNRLAYWVSEPDKGIYDAMNKGIALATGEVIGLLNAGDWYLEDAIQLLASQLQTEPSIYYGDALIFYPDLNQQRLAKANLSGLRHHMSICHQATFVATRIYQQRGLYKTNYRLAADYDFLSRCYHKNVAFRYLKQPVILFANGGASDQNIVLYKRECLSIAKQSYFSVADRLRMLRKFFIEITLSFGYKALRKMLGNNLSAVLRRKWQHG
ncbi:MAG: glycosyltransferase [Anaerolineae bacterium]|nr:glycosyltransferase [Anaerolineae bacterium]